MDFLNEYHLSGLVIGICTFLIIGLFHPIVVKAEYYWGTKCWWIFLFTRHRRHHCLPLYGEHHDSLPFGRLCIFLVLDHQGDIRAGRTSEKKAGFPRIQNEFISSKDKGYKEFYPKVLHISIENATFVPAIQARMHRTCSSVG